MKENVLIVGGIGAVVLIIVGGTPLFPENFRTAAQFIFIPWVSALLAFNAAREAKKDLLERIKNAVLICVILASLWGFLYGEKLGSAEPGDPSSYVEEKRKQSPPTPDGKFAVATRAFLFMFAGAICGLVLHEFIERKEA